MTKMVEVTQEDANNYCRVLAALGMEEEGDPVAEIERLKGVLRRSANIMAGGEGVQDQGEAWDRTQKLLNAAVANWRNPYFEGQHGAEEPDDTAARLALVAERDALREAGAELTRKAAELIEHLQKTGRLRDCFNMPALDAARKVFGA